MIAVVDAGLGNLRSVVRALAAAGAQRLGRERFYEMYRVRIATVEREYGFSRSGT